MSQGLIEHQVARVEELPEGRSKKFTLTVGGQQIEGFVVNYRGSFYAYLNRCCHIPMPMDWFENQFLSEDGRFIICATHGATYDPATGECVAGPCPGEYLNRLPLQIVDGTLLVLCPPADQV
jgi:nitrite reductase/ring-hydroxylating ferredoxin subunit